MLVDEVSARPNPYNVAVGQFYTPEASRYRFAFHLYHVENTSDITTLRILFKRFEMESRGTAMDQEGQYVKPSADTTTAQLSESQTSDNEIKKSEGESGVDVAGEESKPQWKPDYRFWCILASLGIGVTMAGVENTIIVTALPFIIEDLGNGKTYVWIANVHLLAG